MADWLEAWPLVQLLGVMEMSGFVLCQVYLARKEGRPGSPESVAWEPSLQTVSCRGADLLWHLCSGLEEKGELGVCWSLIILGSTFKIIYHTKVTGKTGLRREVIIKWKMEQRSCEPLIGGGGNTSAPQFPFEGKPVLD